jgi:hypothetical protein
MEKLKNFHLLRLLRMKEVREDKNKVIKEFFFMNVNREENFSRRW